MGCTWPFRTFQHAVMHVCYMEKATVARACGFWIKPQYSVPPLPPPLPAPGPRQIKHLHCHPNRLGISQSHFSLSQHCPHPPPPTVPFTCYYNFPTPTPPPTPSLYALVAATVPFQTGLGGEGAGCVYLVFLSSLTSSYFERCSE